MSSTVYEQVLETITHQLAESLERSRAHPFPASPAAGGNEPMDADLYLRGALAEATKAVPDASAEASGTAAPVAAAPVATAVVVPGAARFAGVGDLLTAFRGGVTTPSAVLSELEPLWGPAGPAPDAVLSLIPGAAAAAAESDRRWASGTARPLEGIPFAVKDIIDVEGALVTCGSLQTGDRIATADATIVARLRAAGAIPVFMSATTEFACGGPVSARYGSVANPWNPERWTGGSSTGSGAALAARLVPLAIGTDTGGSIRVPSALCGVTGIKPTYGLVPRTGVASLSWTLDHTGPMARSAADLALVLGILAGPDGVDPAAASTRPPLSPVVSVDGALRAAFGIASLRIGVPTGYFTERVDAAVLEAYEGAIEVFRMLGATIVDVEFDELAGLSIDEITDECWNIFYAEFASTQEGNAGRRELFDDGTRARFDTSSIPAADYLRALRRRPLVQRAMHARMNDAGVDVLLTPGVGATAPRLDDLSMSVDGQRFNLHDVIPRNTRIFDCTGFPGLMMPAGFAPDGMPVGVQLVARPYDDRLCLAAAIAFQQVTDHHTKLPPAVGAASATAPTGESTAV